jgi:hypothetical protein
MFILREDATVSAALPLDEVGRCPEDVFNRILWHAMKGPLEPYPQSTMVMDRNDD